ncbi:hypothetical protein CYG49_02500 [Candidatus Saccharibacteria bacterium]|nr:MAG: hypothetical protein CYG49_02500 [Candidatus Saccharibacteria bacterium]
MILNKKSIYSKLTSVFCILLTLIIANILVLFPTITFLPMILWFILLGPILGALTLSLFIPHTKFRAFEWYLYCFGIAIIVLYLMGLLVNTLGILLHVSIFNQPIMLTTANILLISLLCTWALSSSNKNTSATLFPALLDSKTARVTLIFGFILPLVTSLGAIRLNNGGSNVLAIIGFILIILYICRLIIKFKTHSANEFAIAIFFASIALTLSVSLRSNHLLGFDINQEYQVYQLALENGVWRPGNLRDAYNACLSITILPALYGSILLNHNEFIFKFLFQLYAGVVSIAVFAIAAQTFKDKIHFAFISSLFFIIQGQFIFQFPGLVRQLISLIFFGLIFLTLQSPLFSRNIKFALILLFGLGMVLSHYSTSYITIALILFISFSGFSLLLLKSTLCKLLKHEKNVYLKFKPPFNLSFVLLLFLFTFLWNFQIIKSTGGVVDKIGSTITSVFDNDEAEKKSYSEFVTSVFGIGNRNVASIDEIAQKLNVSNTYKPSQSEYAPREVSVDSQVGKTSNQATIFNNLRKIIPLIANLFLVIGLLFLIVKYLRSNTDIYQAALAVGASALLASLVILPGISNSYNVERLYQQLLIVISPAFAIGISSLFKKFQSKYQFYFASILVSLYFIGSSSFADLIMFETGNINFSTSGITYSRFYVSDAEKATVIWIEENIQASKDLLYADRYSTLPLRAYSSFKKEDIRQGLLPNEIKTNSYIYVSNTNTNLGVGYGFYNNRVYSFNFPEDYLKNNKNVIYSTNKSEVYR